MKLPGPRVQDATVEAITGRRAACGDEDLEAMRDDPAGLIRYVLAHRRVPREVLAQDVADVLTLIRCQQAELTRAMHAALRLARSPEVGMTWGDIATHVGMGTPQGAMQLFERLDQERNGGQRSEVDWRRARREARWIAQHVSAIEAAAGRVIDAGSASGIDVDALRDALESQEWSATTVMVWLRIAVREMLDVGLVAEADPSARLVRQWERVGPRRRAAARR